MKKRILQIQHLTPEQLKYLLTHVQWLCMKENRYFIVVEDIDWYIVLHVLFEQGIINKGNIYIVFSCNILDLVGDAVKLSED